MPRYAYRAIDQISKPKSGVMVCENEDIVEQRLSEIGLFLIELKIDKQKVSKLGAKVSRRELVDLFNGLSTMLDAGIDVSKALSILQAETKQSDLSNVLSDIKLNVESGIALDEAMGEHPQQFAPEICNLIRAGSYSGELAEACKNVASHIEWVDNLVSDIKQATIYPATIIIAVFGLILLLFGYVVPRFTMIFDSLHLELPLITRGVIAIGAFIVTYWWIMAIVVFLLVVTLKLLIKSRPVIALEIDRMLLKLPLFGTLNTLLCQSQFTHNLSLMLRAGVPIVEALSLLSGVVKNRAAAKAFAEAESAVIQGRTMSDGLAAHSDLFTPMVMRMIIIGEESGKLDACLEAISKRLDDDIPRRIKRLFGVLEPSIILVLIGMVGLVAMAIFLPLFGLMGGIMS